MSEFIVTVVALDDVVEHENADRLEIASVGGYRAVVLKGEYRKGDLCIYIPEGAIVPENILAALGLTDKLAGSAKNRVKAVRLRGVLSQGIVAPLGLLLDCDIASALGITKHEPATPFGMSGEVFHLANYPIKYDIENIKRYPHVLDADEDVILSEKIHGTFCQIGWGADLFDERLFGDGGVWICSKGLGRQGMVFLNNEDNIDNLYVKTMRSVELPKILPLLRENGFQKVVLLGEIFGDVQDLKYGMTSGQHGFRVFEVTIDDVYLDADRLESWITWLNEKFDLTIEVVPPVTKGKWRDIKERLDLYTKGKSLLAPNQIREGVVIRPARELHHDRLGRVILKSVSEDYLLRRNENATEFA